MLFLVESKNTYEVSLERHLTVSGTEEITSTDVKNSGSFSSYVKLIIKRGIPSIGKEGFKGCTSLLSIEFPDNDLTKISESAFESCSSLTSVILPEGLLTLQDRVFMSCSSLKSIEFPSTLSSISFSFLFYDCNQLSTIKVNSNNPNFRSVNDKFITDNTMTICYHGTAENGVLTFPSTIVTVNSYCLNGRHGFTKVLFAGNKVETISDCAFRHTSVKDIVLPDGLLNIYSLVFNGASISSIELPSSITTLSTNVFSGASSLTEITLRGSSNYLSIDQGTLKSSTTIFFVGQNAESLTIEEGIKNLPLKVISLVKSLRTINVNSNNPYFFSDDNVIYNKTNNCVFAIAGGVEEATINEACVGFLESCFEGSSIKRLTFKNPSKITYIERGAFIGVSMDSLEIPSGLTSLSDYCFSSATIKSITVPNTISLIYDYAFTRSIIPKVDLSNTKVTTLRLNVFELTKINEIILPSGLQTIQNYALKDSSLITSITIPSGVTSLGTYTFSGCVSLSEVVFESTSITELGEQIFSGCGFTSFTVPASITTIGNLAFADCNKLSQFEFAQRNENSDIHLKTSFIKGCPIESIQLPQSVVIEKQAFSGSFSLLRIEVEGKRYLSVDGIVYDSTKTVFTVCPPGLNKVSIDEMITNIAECAFYECSKLESVTLLGSSPLSEISDSAFFGCSKLSSIRIPKAVEHIASNAFSSCVGLKSVIFSNGSKLNEVTNDIFSGCVNIEEFVFEGESSLNRIGDYSFSGFTKLKTFKFNSNLDYIGVSAFDGCNALSTFSLPSSVKYISKNSFRNTMIEVIHLPDGLLELGESAFSGCPLDMVIYCGDSRFEKIAFESIKVTVRMDYEYERLGGVEVSKVMGKGCTFPTSHFTFPVANNGFNQLLVASLSCCEDE